MFRLFFIWLIQIGIVAGSTSSLVSTIPSYERAPFKSNSAQLVEAAALDLDLTEETEQDGDSIIDPALAMSQPLSGDRMELTGLRFSTASFSGHFSRGPPSFGDC